MNTLALLHLEPLDVPDQSPPRLKPVCCDFGAFSALDSSSSKEERLLSSPSSFVILSGLNGDFDSGRRDDLLTVWTPLPRDHSRPASPA